MVGNFFIPVRQIEITSYSIFYWAARNISLADCLSILNGFHTHLKNVSKQCQIELNKTSDGNFRNRCIVELDFDMY